MTAHHLEIDHLFLFIEPDGPEIDALRRLGFSETYRRAHPGQGTANVCFAFDNLYLELLWLTSEAEARSGPIARTRLSLTEEPLAERSWRRAWAALGVPAPLSVMTQLLDAYAESQRHYHSLQHLRECQTQLESALALAQRPAIYSTDLFRERFEAHARENLRQAIGTLAG